ncbi:DUF3368 domain-containing protein [Rubrivirga sp.]|uniref:DUF3368 domain-containing protein n=1 Tax=Rubrivirga sp. TaxID=1885344 RepID=UPI003B52230D
MSPLVVTDTSCLIALSGVGRLGLLPALFTDVVAPHAVVAEYEPKASAPLPGWLREVEVADRAGVRRLLLRGLDWGESEAITLARSLPGALLLADERRGRRAAAGFGLPILETAGLLLTAKREGRLAAVRPVLDEMRDRHGFRLADAIYEQVLREAGED